MDRSRAFRSAVPVTEVAAAAFVIVGCLLRVAQFKIGSPVLDAVKTLAPAVGEQRNFRTGERYRFEAEHLAALADYRLDEATDEQVLVLLDLADELLDSALTARYFQSKPGVRVVCYEGGAHRFAHLGEALIEIRRFLETE